MRAVESKYIPTLPIGRNYSEDVKKKNFREYQQNRTSKETS
jgi:hypothetical protein